MSVLLIGGLDPLGRAGLLADLQACAGFDTYAVCSVLTAQDDERVSAMLTPSESFAAQLASVFAANEIIAVKTGWLGNEEQVEILLSCLPRQALLVVDTLFHTSSGFSVYGDDVRAPTYQRLLKRADLITPNIPEAEALIAAPISDPVEALSVLRGQGLASLLLKGGHVDGEVCCDTLFKADGSLEFFRHTRVAGLHRGTGCRLASGIAARLGSGQSMEAAIQGSSAWLQGWLRR